MIPVLLASCCPQSATPASYSPSDEPWVTKAIEWGFGPGKDARREALKTTNPVVIYLPETVCVGLKLKPNSLGGESTVCFSRADGSIVTSHNEGE